MNLSDITILIPTKGRPHLVTKLSRAIDHRPLVFIVNQDSWENDLPEAKTRHYGTLYSPADRLGPPFAVEYGVREILTPLFVAIPDDVAPQPGWLEEALRVYNESFGDGDGVVSINNGMPMDRELACFALMSKRFYMELIYPCPYERYFQDTEWTFKAKALRRYAYAENAKVWHQPFEEQNSGAWARDLKLFETRVKEFTNISGCQSIQTPSQSAALE